MIKIEESTIENAYEIHQEIPEFLDPDDTLMNFKKRLQGKDNLILIGLCEDKPAGYLIGYDRWQDGSFFCWMAAVKPDFRRNGIFNSLMKYQLKWAKKRGYTSIKIVTRNSRREMLSYLVKNGFNFISIDQRDKITSNRISLSKEI